MEMCRVLQHCSWKVLGLLYLAAWVQAVRMRHRGWLPGSRCVRSSLVAVPGPFRARLLGAARSPRPARPRTVGRDVLQVRFAVDVGGIVSSGCSWKIYLGPSNPAVIVKTGKTCVRVVDQKHRPVRQGANMTRQTLLVRASGPVPPAGFISRSGAAADKLPPCA